MAGLFVTRDAALVAAADARFAAQGLGSVQGFAVPGWHVRHYGYGAGGPPTLLSDGDDHVAIAGTLACDGAVGQPALAALLRMARRGAIDRARLAGEFVALVRCDGRTRLFGDALGLFQLFVAGDTLSTSLIAAVETLPRVRWNRQGVYEWAFNVTALGDDTVFQEVALLPAGRTLTLTRAGMTVRDDRAPLPDAAAAKSPADRLAHHRAVLAGVLAPHVAAQGDRIRCPLSGGLDSRLLLAALRAAGSSPEVYVYGLPGSTDVAIARAVGDRLGFPVAWIDKARERIDPDAFPATVARNFDAFDALPTYGNIFDNGGHLAARIARHADGWLAASGGAGEIYRDFFYLPDRPVSADTVARTFFARFAPGDATTLFDASQFLRTIADKILASLGIASERSPLPRTLVDQIYPRFRCRALFGREISLEARQGPWLVPFLDPRVVAATASLSHHDRVAGRFEAQLLAAIDTELAAQPSAYGHAFDGPPGRRHRLAEWATRVRPAWLRQHSYALKRRFRGEGDEHGGELSARYMRRVVDLDFPAMRRFFHVDAINDSGLWRRIACLEYLAARLGSRLVD